MYDGSMILRRVVAEEEKDLSGRQQDAKFLYAPPNPTTKAVARAQTAR